MLIANKDFVIIDFEASRRGVADSRRKHSPLRDGHGMLRSFSYAKWSARAAPNERFVQPGRVGRRRGARLLAAYLCRGLEGSGLYASFEDVQGLLRFELEKVLYELRSRSTTTRWIHVPLAA